MMWHMRACVPHWMMKVVHYSCDRAIKNVQRYLFWVNGEKRRER